MAKVSHCTLISDEVTLITSLLKQNKKKHAKLELLIVESIVATQSSFAATLDLTHIHAHCHANSTDRPWSESCCSTVVYIVVWSGVENLMESVARSFMD